MPAIQMMKPLFLFLLVILTGCASAPTPFETLEIDSNQIYRFNNPNLNSVLYIRFLPPTEKSQELLFKTSNLAERVSALEIGMPGVIHQKQYLLNERGKLRFAVQVVGLFEELMRFHQYSSFGIQQDELTVFRYRLDMRRAVEHN